MIEISTAISAQQKPALLIGNGINLFNGKDSADWSHLLAQLALDHNLNLTQQEVDEMSNTEFFDILDLSKHKADRSSLQQQFCALMTSWKPDDHHNTIVKWAQNYGRPIVTVNFDENLSKSVGANFYRSGNGFTDYYPWNCYFSDSELDNAKSDFAIWHAHGMMKYPRSIRLGLTHYMGSVQRARSQVNGDQGLRSMIKNGGRSWRGGNSWLEILFFCPLLIFGFTFSKDETFLRWLFLERARLHKANPAMKKKTWFVDTPESGSLHRKAFFKCLGMEYIAITDYAEIYQNPAWDIEDKSFNVTD